MKLGNYKIGTRLAASFAILLSLLIAIALLGVNRMASIEQRMQNVIAINDVESTLAMEMRATVAERMIALRNVVLLPDEAGMRPEVNRVVTQNAAYRNADGKLRNMFASTPTTPEEFSALERATSASTAAGPVMETIARLGLVNDNERATHVLLAELKPIQEKWDAALLDLAQIEAKQNEDAAVEAHQAYANSCMEMLGITMLALGVGALIAWAITRSIVIPLRSAVVLAQSVAAGDLTQQVGTTGNDEVAELLRALGDMNHKLSRIVGSVRLSAISIASASTEIATGNLDLSARTEEQASALEETASAMEELTTTVRQNAQSANEANAMAEAASDVAVKGGAVVDQVVTTMTSISNSSKKIAEIISVIDGIAFQTNILALNAAVEAARAGEQGRGFAVVATEVRNLAHRSASAAKEIKALIDDSVSKVAAGGKLATEAGATMKNVVASVQRVTVIMKEIAQASLEQSGGIAQVNDAISSMDSVTQQNAALVEEAAAAATALQEQAEVLSREVSVFRIETTLPSSRASQTRSVPQLRLALST